VGVDVKSAQVAMPARAGMTRAPLQSIQKSGVQPRATAVMFAPRIPPAILTKA
jgi:hypothetical protein